jgi:hypothetical protein
MHFLWFLLAMVLVVPIIDVWMTRRSAKRELCSCKQPVSQPSVPLETSAKEQPRMIKWISIGEFMTVLKRCNDLVVFDLRADAQRVPFLVLKAPVIPVTQEELVQVLEWLPANRTVAIFGATNLSVFMIETGLILKRSEPLYLLDGDPSFLEAA